MPTITDIAQVTIATPGIASPGLRSPLRISDNITLSAAHYNRIIVCENDEPIKITVPFGLYSAQPFRIYRKSAGDVDITTTRGVALLYDRALYDPAIALQYQQLKLLPITANAWIVSGDLRQARRKGLGRIIKASGSAIGVGMLSRNGTASVTALGNIAGRGTSSAYYDTAIDLTASPNIAATTIRTPPSVGAANAIALGRASGVGTITRTGSGVLQGGATVASSNSAQRFGAAIVQGNGAANGAAIRRVIAFSFNTAIANASGNGIIRKVSIATPEAIATIAGVGSVSRGSGAASLTGNGSISAIAQIRRIGNGVTTAATGAISGVGVAGAGGLGQLRAIAAATGIGIVRRNSTAIVQATASAAAIGGKASDRVGVAIARANGNVSAIGASGTFGGLSPLVLYGYPVSQAGGASRLRSGAAIIRADGIANGQGVRRLVGVGIVSATAAVNSTSTEAVILSPLIMYGIPVSTGSVVSTSKFGNANIIATSNIAASGSVRRTGVGAIAATGTASAVTSSVRLGVGALTASANATAIAQRRLIGVTITSATTNATATGAVQRNSIGALVAAASVTSSGTVRRSGAVILSATASAAGSGGVRRNATGAIAGIGNIASAGTHGRFGAAAVAGTGAIAATGNAVSLESYIAINLPNVPSDRRSAVATAATTAAAGQTFSPVQVLDYIVALDFYSSFLRGDGCLFTDAGATTPANTIGDAVAIVRNWKNNSTWWAQSTATARPTVTDVEGIVFTIQGGTIRRLKWTRTAGITAAEIGMALKTFVDPTTNTLNQRFFAAGMVSTSSGVYVRAASNSGDAVVDMGAANDANRLVYNPVVAPNVFALLTAWSRANDRRFYMNNENGVSASNDGATFGTVWALGGAPNDTDRFDGNMKFMRFHSSKLTDEHRLALQRFDNAYYSLGITAFS